MDIYDYDSEANQSSWSKVYPRQNQTNRTHAVTACISLWCHGAMHAVHACIGLWCQGPMHALTACNLKFQVCLWYTFTLATLIDFSFIITDIYRKVGTFVVATNSTKYFVFIEQECIFWAFQIDGNNKHILMVTSFLNVFCLPFQCCPL